MWSWPLNPLDRVLPPVLLMVPSKPFRGSIKTHPVSSRRRQKETCPESKQNWSISIIFSLLNVAPTVKMLHGGIFNLGPLAEQETPKELQTRSPQGQMKQPKHIKLRKQANKTIQKLQLKRNYMQGVKRKFNTEHYCVEYLYDDRVFLNWSSG